MNIDVKPGELAEAAKEVAAALDPFVKSWTAGLKDALSNFKIEIKVTGIYPDKGNTTP